MVSSRRLFLISGLAGSLASAQPTCTAEGPCPQLDDENALLQVGRDGPPPCWNKKCGDDCFNRQNRMGKCNFMEQCDVGGGTPDCSGGGWSHDQGVTKPMYCEEPQAFTCYSKGWPSCCVDNTRCATEKPPCDISGGGAAADEFHVASIGSCQPPAKFIEDKSQCGAAAGSLELEQKVNDAGAPTNPYGCYFKDAETPGRKLWFNPNGDKNNVDPTRRSICQSAVETECMNKACGTVCSKGACSANGKCLGLSHPAELGCHEDEKNLLVSITEYDIDSSLDTDEDSWWSSDDADAFVEVICGATRFVSAVSKEQNHGNVKLHFFAERRSSSCVVKLHDDDGHRHETILSQAMSLNPGSGRLSITHQSCTWPWCHTVTGAWVKYAIVHGATAKNHLSNLGAKLTPGKPIE